MDFSKFHPVEQQEMLSCVAPTIFKCFDGKPIGTDLVKMGLFRGNVLAVKIEGNEAIFALPYHGPMTLLKDYLAHEERDKKIVSRHYNPTDSIIYDFDINDDNTELIMTFYTREYKLF